MKKWLVVFLSVLVLNGCQSNPEKEAEDVGLSNQYSRSATNTSAASINTQLGAGYIANGRYDRALLKLNKAINQDTDYALAHNFLGVLYSRLERPEYAYKEFKKSVALAPNDSTILNNYAIFLCDQSKYQEAQQKFKKVLNNPLYLNRAGAYQSAASCAFKNHKIERAEKFYRKALELNPDLSGASLGLAKVYYNKGEYDYAWNYFKRFDDAAVQTSDSLWLGINILNNLSDPDDDLLASYELQLKSKFPDSDETKWFYQGKQDY